MSPRLHTLRSAWPFALTFLALAATGGTDGTCGGGGVDPVIEVCTVASDCPKVPMDGPGQWACVDGGCQWQKSEVPECQAPQDCIDRLHDACAGAWSCIDQACRWSCNEPNPTCAKPADCEGKAHMECDGAWTCPGGECVWTCIGPPPTCVVSGCSGEICATGSIASDCVWKDWFQCLKFTSCGLLADGTCGFDPNEAFTKCLSGATACAADTDCPEGQACIQNECRPTCVPAPEVCDGQDNDCNGVVDEGCPPTACITDADCGLLHACDHAGYADAPGCCVALPDGTGCPDDYPRCPGVCVRIPGACLHDSDCKAGQACQGALPCDCPEGAMCKCAPIVVGTCVAVEPPACTMDAECPDGEACVAGLCVVTGPTCRVVTPGSHGACKMMIGWIFDGRQCVSEGGCTCEPDCDAVFKSEDACASACGLPVACATDSDCAFDQACVNGVCQARPSACAPVKPNSHGACEMMLGAIFDGSKCVYESGCSCQPDCAAIFPDLPTCKKACLTY